MSLGVPGSHHPWYLETWGNMFFYFLKTTVGWCVHDLNLLGTLNLSRKSNQFLGNEWQTSAFQSVSGHKKQNWGKHHLGRWFCQKDLETILLLHTWGRGCYSCEWNHLWRASRGLFTKGGTESAQKTKCGYIKTRTYYVHVDYICHICVYTHIFVYAIYIYVCMYIFFSCSTRSLGHWYPLLEWSKAAVF